MGSEGEMINLHASNPGFSREGVININHYATKKSVAESMLDVALFMANAAQLKAIVEQGPSFHYYVALIVLISVSLFFQMTIGILLIVMARLNLNDVAKQERLDLLNNITTVLVFITVIINIFITAFGVQKTGLYPNFYGRRFY
ncbi:ninjurin-2 [Crotalus tigris]|uniref:ninjurin-2 n=1 Tax=Crotalus tigris TaxID=88082 RepID=UPI00192FAB4E|nr:ninjurin-2 [Crotalus tigris]